MEAIEIDWDSSKEADYYVAHESRSHFFVKTVDGEDFFQYAKDGVAFDQWELWDDTPGFKTHMNKFRIDRPIPNKEDFQALEDEFMNQLPDWAMGKNEHKLLFPGVQLATKDGRRTGNAYIVCTDSKDWGNVYLLLTDAGNKIVATETEIHSMFYVGDYYCSVGRILKDFDRNQEFVMYPGC